MPNQAETLIEVPANAAAGAAFETERRPAGEKGSGPERAWPYTVPMRQSAVELTFHTPGRGLVDVTREVSRWVSEQGLRTGLTTIFCRHTSCSLLIQENAAPAARADLEAFFARIAPEDPSSYTHDEEGPDDMPAHIRAALTQVQLTVPLLDGSLALGRWQGIFLFEHRRRPHARTLAVHLIGE